MATYNSAQEADTRATPNTRIPPAESSGEVRVARFSFDQAATGQGGGSALAGNDIIRLCRLPLGARVIFGELEITTASGNSGITLDIGDTNDVDRYGDGLATNSATQLNLANTVALHGLLSHRVGTGDATGRDPVDNPADDVDEIHIQATVLDSGSSGVSAGQGFAFEGYLLYVQS
jgi:hypothetical protein